MLKLLAPILLTLSFSACSPPVTIGKAPPPEDKLVCVEAPVKPDLKPLTVVKTSDGTFVYLKAEVDQRDFYIANYIVDYKGAYYSCKSQLQWNKDYHESE